MAPFGLQPNDWPEWQNELVGTIGTIAGFAGAAAGLWLAIRSERRAVREGQRHYGKRMSQAPDVLPPVVRRICTKGREVSG